MGGTFSVDQFENGLSYVPEVFDQGLDLGELSAFLHAPKGSQVVLAKAMGGILLDVCFLRVYSGHEKRMLLLLTSDFDPFLLCILDAKREPNKDDLSHLVTVTVDFNRICVLRSSFPKNVVTASWRLVFRSTVRNPRLGWGGHMNTAIEDQWKVCGTFRFIFSMSIF